jgi:hypothetical protein
MPKKAQQNERLALKQNATVAHRSTDAPLKRPLDLQNMLKSVKLIPPEAEFTGFPMFGHDYTGQPLTLEETTADLLAGLQELPEPLRLHLLEYMHPDKWETREADIPLAIQQNINVTRRFYEIFFWRKNLRALVRREHAIRITAEVRPDQKGRARVYYEDPFVSALEGVKLDLLRECLVCKHIFLAKRDNQSCDTPRCAKTQRKRNERANAKLRAKGMTKKKRADPARKRR